MAKYYVQTKTTSNYEKKYGFPLINIIPAIVWSIPFHQKLFPDASFWMTLLLCGLFVVVYVILSFSPVISAIPCIASGIMLTAMFWALFDWIDNSVIRIIIKIIILAIAVLIELGIFANAMIPWLEAKMINDVKVIKVEE